MNLNNLDLKVREKQGNSRQMPVTTNRITRAQAIQTRSLSKRRSKPSRRTNISGKMPNINLNVYNVGHLEKPESKIKKKTDDANYLKVKRDIEETLSNEVERILIEIYSNNIWGKNFDISKYDNYVSLLLKLTFN